MGKRRGKVGSKASSPAKSSPVGSGASSPAKGKPAPAAAPPPPTPSRGGTSRRLIVLAAAGACLAAVWVVLVPPLPLADRLAAIDERETSIDNGLYSLPEFTRTWWAPPRARSLGLLSLLNAARLPYFVRHFDALLPLSSPAASEAEARARRRLLRSSLRVLDVGCGGGVASEPLARAGFSVSGVDISAASIAAAEAHADAEAGKQEKEKNEEEEGEGEAEAAAASAWRRRLSYRVASAYALPFAAASFDAVVCSDVLEHLHDVPRALREMRRVLRPGGLLVFDTVNRSWLSWLVSIVGAQRLLGLLPPRTHDWRLFLTPREMRVALFDAGFRLPAAADERQWRAAAAALGVRDDAGCAAAAAAVLGGGASICPSDGLFARGMAPTLRPLRLLSGGLLPGVVGSFRETADLRNSYLGWAFVPPAPLPLPPQQLVEEEAAAPAAM